jgi:hypothetical protein
MTMRHRYLAAILRVAPLVIACTVAATFALGTGVSASGDSSRSKRLHVTKECSEYTYAAGSFCTITFSSLGRIPVNAKVFYTQAAGIIEGLLDSNVVLDAGNGNRAVGHCTLDAVTGLGLCTFSDGTGRLAGFNARVDVRYLGAFDYAWDGTYSFEGRD